MRITLCTSVASDGGELFKLFIESAARLASGAHEIGIEFTCHDEGQRNSLLQASSLLEITGSYVVKPEHSMAYFHARSITHSRCVNTLYASVQADVAVICDSDVAFTYKDWDAVLVEQIVSRGNSFVGTPYADKAGSVVNLPHGQVFARKYQAKPNCTFIAFSPQLVKTIADRLCDLATAYNYPEAIPVQLVTTRGESQQFGLPIGSFRQLDAGSRIPEIIERMNRRYRSLEQRVGQYEILKFPIPPVGYPLFLQPEEYLYKRVPYIVHFRKGSMRPASNDIYSREQFVADVRARLDAAGKPAS